MSEDRLPPNNCKIDNQANLQTLQGQTPPELEREQLHHRLEKALADIVFTGQDKVLARIQPPGWHRRFRAWLNQDVAVPIMPVMLLMMITGGFLVLYPRVGTEHQPEPSEVRQTGGRSMVEIGGSRYWEDELQRRLVVNGYTDEN
ncbi:hypothetical protein Q5741_12695 [Paenibacillus sp. JX-17]|uniref:Uncharacterized protein n=1 Tax=Paenibacillus lacisoli TaxID=3064525 RepID=A0ABT9CEH4_9BACL|nr:hypothetical protein [Paenibacillus sp. JX-17]MDO7907270.1 hypothetical protein [Paenibacillus sp. JX-17]